MAPLSMQAISEVNRTRHTYVSWCAHLVLGTNHGRRLASPGCRSQKHTAATRASHSIAPSAHLQKSAASLARLTNLSPQNFQLLSITEVI